MSRCKCTNRAVCGDLEDLVLRMARDGKLPPHNSEPYPWQASVDGLRLKEWVGSREG